MLIVKEASDIAVAVAVAVAPVAVVAFVRVEGRVCRVC